MTSEACTRCGGPWNGGSHACPDEPQPSGRPPLPRFELLTPLSASGRRLVSDFYRASKREQFVAKTCGGGGKRHRVEAKRLQTALGALWNAGLLKPLPAEGEEITAAADVAAKDEG